MFESLKLSDLPKNNCGILRQPSSTRPTIWVVEEDGKRAAVKDFSANGFLYRNIIGRLLIWREGRAYSKLAGLKGVPAFYRIIDGLALVVEEIDGRPIENLHIEQEMKLTESFFDELKELVDKIHERGISHCDIKRSANILLGRDGRPYLVDLAAAISEGEFRLFPLNLIYRRFLLDDYNAIIKFKLRHIPDAVTKEEKERYSHRSGPERVVRRIRDRLRSILRKVA